MTKPPPTRRVNVHLMLTPEIDRLLSQLATRTNMNRSQTVEALIVAAHHSFQLPTAT